MSGPRVLHASALNARPHCARVRLNVYVHVCKRVCKRVYAVVAHGFGRHVQQKMHDLYMSLASTLQPVTKLQLPQHVNNVSQ
eukprot:3916097-Pleurochrysis_carterae.AAC.1